VYSSASTANCRSTAGGQWLRETPEKCRLSAGSREVSFWSRSLSFYLRMVAARRAIASERRRPGAFARPSFGRRRLVSSVSAAGSSDGTAARSRPISTWVPRPFTCLPTRCDPRCPDRFFPARAHLRVRRSKPDPRGRCVSPPCLCGTWDTLRLDAGFGRWVEIRACTAPTSRC
jgi:hypothetical protein